LLSIFWTLVTALLVIPPILAILVLTFGAGNRPPFENLLILVNAETVKITVNTLLFALAKTFIALIVALYSSWLVTRTDVPFKRLFESALILHLMLPGFITSIAWILLASPKIGVLNLLLNPLGVSFNIYSFLGLVWVQSTLTFPYASMILISVLTTVNPELEEAAQIAGCKTLTRIRQITLPLIKPAIFSIILLSVILGLEAFDVPLYIGNPVGISFLSVAIYEKVSFLPPEYGKAGALSLLLIALTLSLLIPYMGTIRSMAKYAVVTGKTRVPKLIRLGKLRWLFGASLILIMLLYIFLPFAIVVVTSFSRGFGFLLLPGEQFTLSHFINSLSNPIVVRSIINSIFAGAIGATFGSLVVIFVAYLVVRTKVKVRSVLEFLATLPLCIPGIVLAYGFFLTYLATPIYGTIWLIVLAFLVKSIPWVQRSFSPSLSQISAELEDAARVAGASWFFTFGHIIVKLTIRALIAGWVLAFIFNLRELAIPSLLYFPRSELLAPQLYHLWTNGFYNEACALSTLYAVLILILLVLIKKLAGRELAHTQTAI
jgi:iron(III) transport system permease protein